MAEWDGKSRGNKLGYQIFVFLLKYAGVYPAYGLLIFVSFYYFLFAPKTSAPTINFYRRRFGYGWLKSYRMLYRNYFMLGQTLIDRVVVTAGLGGQITHTSNGAENLKAMVAQKRGGILLGSHIGNWGIASKYLMTYDSAINILIYEVEHEQIKEYMNQVTGGRKYNMIIVKDDLSHIYAIGEALLRNEIICMTADRYLPGSRTMMVDFMGEKAAFPVGPFQIIKTYKAPYTFVYGLKKGATHYNCYAKPYREVKPETTVQNIMEDYAHDLEEMVKLYPDQWFNYYDFWKKPN
jgi:predicted LPLAT superfamily acyltransferase